MDTRKNRKLLNTVSVTCFSCSLLLYVLSSVVANSRTFNDSYEVTFGDARVEDIHRDLRSSDFIPNASTTT